MLENPVRLGSPAAVEHSHLVRDFLCCHSASAQADSAAEALLSAPLPPGHQPGLPPNRRARLQAQHFAHLSSMAGHS